MMAKERASGQSFFPVWVRHEHTARYEFSAGYAKGKVVVDCACGDGTGSMTFSKAGARMVEAFDLGQEAVEAAAKRWGSDTLRFHVCNALSLPLSDRFADLYISLETIEHVDQDVPFLKEVVRLLKTDGIFICSTPNRHITNPGKSISDKPWNPFHVREYSDAEFLELLSRAFGKVEMFGQNPQFGPKVAMMRMLGAVLPFDGAVKINQAFKVLQMVLDKYEKHIVRAEQRICEYLIAVCSKPRAF